MIHKIRTLAAVLTTVLALSACALNSYQAVNTADYTVSLKNFDVTVGWNVIKNDLQTTVDGYVRNNRYLIMQDLELWISLLDAAGIERARKSYFIIPTSLPRDEHARFTVEFASGAQSGDKLRFLYRYKGVEDNENALPWMNSFEAPL